MRFRGRGFTETCCTPVYAHYVFAGKSQKTVRLGVPTGPCGLFSIKRKQFPFKNSPRRGVWTIQFDQERVYNPKAAVQLPAHRPRPQGGQAAAGSGSLTAVRVKRRPSPSGSTSTSIRSPLAKSPLSRASASGSTSRLEITRFSGRAPYAGS